MTGVAVTIPRENREHKDELKSLDFVEEALTDEILTVWIER